MLTRICSAAVLLAALSAIAGEGSGPYLSDLAGKRVAYSDLLAKSKITVVVAVATKCPVVRKEMPRLNKLFRKWKGKGVEFLLVDPASYDSETSLKAELKEWSNRIPAFVDHDREVSRALKLNVTGKAVVLKEGAAVYAGAIDDQFTFDGAKPLAQKEFLEDVLTAISRNETVPYQDHPTSAAGCAISLD